jgi:hypothetical protein
MASDGDRRQPLITVHERGGLVFGLRDGKLISINDVDSGLACNCVCPNSLCGDRLVAHKGQKLAYHFKHHNRKECKAGFETGLHMMAKEVLAEALEFLVPAYSRGYGKNREVVFEEKTIHFERAALEKRTGRMVPDVILYTDKGPLLVELVVTHWCDQEKIDLLKIADLACVEVDLSAFRDIWDKESLRDIVVKLARRAWLNYPAAVRRVARLDAERAAEHERKVAGHVDRLGRFYARAGKRSQVQDLAVNVEGLKALHLDQAVGVPIAGDSCFPNRIAWQKTILERLLKTGRGGSGVGLPAKDILAWVKPLVDAEFSDWLPEEVRDEVKARVPEFRSAYDVVLAYLKELEGRKIVTFHKGWHLYEGVRLRALELSRQSELRARRHETVYDLVHEILAEVSDTDKRSFNYEAWLDRSCELGITPREAIDIDCIIEAFPSGAIRNSEDYSELIQGLRRVQNMLTGRGKILDDLFNLPVQGRIREVEAIRAFEEEEADNRRRLREWEAGKARERRLVQTLEGRYPGYDIVALVSERKIEGKPAFEAVRHSDGVLERVLNFLDTELAREVQEADRKREIEGLRQKLLTRCDSTVDPRVARLFLTTQNPSYGGRPIDTCVDESSFQLLWLAASDRANGGKIAWRR